MAEGYSIPINLDRRPPAPNGMARGGEQDIVIRGLEAGWSRAQVVATLEQMRLDSRA